MIIECPHCIKQFEIDDADVKAYTYRLAGQGCSEVKRAALAENAKKPRPGAQGKKKPRKVKTVEPAEPVVTVEPAAPVED